MKKKPIKATVIYLRNGLVRQRPFIANNEEELLQDIFLFKARYFSDLNIYITQVNYHGQTLRWNNFLAHKTFAKGRMTFEEFKAACLNQPEIKTAV